MAKKQTSNPRLIQGKVTNVGDKTVQVLAVTKQPHKIYDKILSSHKKYLAHIEDTSEVEVGDLVTIQEVAPISKRKTWKVLKVTKQED